MNFCNTRATGCWTIELSLRITPPHIPENKLHIYRYDTGLIKIFQYQNIWAPFSCCLEKKCQISKLSQHLCFVFGMTQFIPQWEPVYRLRIHLLSSQAAWKCHSSWRRIFIASSHNLPTPLIQYHLVDTHLQVGKLWNGCNVIERTVGITASPGKYACTPNTSRPTH
jgi:hypothetical protein